MYEIFYLGSIFCALVTIYLLLFKENALRSYPDYLLSLVYLLIIWTSIIYLSIYHGWIIHVPHIYKTAAPINFIVPPFTYLYVRAVLYNEQKFSKKDLWHFIPFGIIIINYFPFYFLSTSIKSGIVLQIVKNLDLTFRYEAGIIPESAVSFLRIFQNLIYIILQWRLILKFKNNLQRAELKKQIVEVIKWLKIFTLAGTLFFIAIIVLTILAIIYNSVFTIGVLNFVPGFLYATSFFVISTYLLTHQEILSGLPFIKYKNTPSNLISDQEDKLAFIDEDFSIAKEAIDTYMNLERPFLSSNLSIGHLAIMLNMPVREVSYIINNFHNKRFPDFINGFRIQYIIDKYHESYLETYTIESIATEAGFNSKSAFYKAFNKIYNITPTEYFDKMKKRS